MLKERFISHRLRALTSYGLRSPGNLALEKLQAGASVPSDRRERWELDGRKTPTTTVTALKCRSCIT